MFQIDRKSVSTSKNGDEKNRLHWQKYLKTQRTSSPIAVIRVLNRLLYNMNNGLH